MRAARPLTPGEIALARSVFGNSIDYSKVRMVRRKWWPFHRQGLFIHEMTHVWQTQTRGRFYLPLMRHPFCRYSYTIEEGRPFDRYGLEQQAEIVRHAFLAERGVRLASIPPRSLLPFA